MGNHIYFEDLRYHDSVEQQGPETVAAHDNEVGGSSVSTETISNGVFVAMATLQSVVRMNCFSSPASAEDKEDQNLADSGDVKNQRKEEETESLLGNNSKGKMKEPSPRVPRNVPNNLQGEQVAAGWPSWLSSVASEAISGWTPLDIKNFQKLYEGETWSDVYQARDGMTGKTVTIKEVHKSAVKAISTEILINRRLNHPNVINLVGVAIPSNGLKLHLVFEYVKYSLADLVKVNPRINFTEPQVQCYVHQLLAGLDHCHRNDVLHRDINMSNLLIDDGETLKIAGFESASLLGTEQQKQPVTDCTISRYQAPELLLGVTDYYNAGIDLWSVGCILGELLAGCPIIGEDRKLVQLDNIFTLCGSPSEEYWRNTKSPHANLFKPQSPRRGCLRETFNRFPLSSLSLIETLLAIDPSKRSTAASALSSTFFRAKSYACKPSNHRWMEMQKKLQADEKRLEKKLQAQADKKQRLAMEELLANFDSDIKEKTSRFWPDGR